MIESKNPSAIRSQRAITQALLSLMKKAPYQEITVKQIILEADRAQKTFYRNFESKDDVLLSLVNGILLEYFDIVNNAKGDVLDTIFAFADRNRELLMLLDRNNMLHVPLKFMNEYAPVLVRQQNRLLNPFVPLFEGLDKEYLIAMNIGAIWNVISLWIHKGLEDDPAAVKETIVQYLRRASGTFS